MFLNCAAIQYLRTELNGGCLPPDMLACNVDVGQEDPAANRTWLSTIGLPPKGVFGDSALPFFSRWAILQHDWVFRTTIARSSERQLVEAGRRVDEAARQYDSGTARGRLNQFIRKGSERRLRQAPRHYRQHP